MRWRIVGRTCQLLLIAYNMSRALHCVDIGDGWGVAAHAFSAFAFAYMFAVQLEPEVQPATEGQ